MCVHVPVDVGVEASLIVLSLVFGMGSLSEPGAHQLEQGEAPVFALQCPARVRDTCSDAWL